MPTTVRIAALLMATCLLLCHAVAIEETHVKEVNKDKIESDPQKEPSCSDDAENGVSDRGSRNRVAVIGCGPGGMFFLHALATKRKKYQEAGDVEGLARLPDMTVYERASDPGGVWRPNSLTSREGSVSMFGGLWSNSPNFELEFFDYTYQEHFGKAVPLYLPWSQLLDYMIARVTQVEDVFHSVKFNTEVTWVTYKNETNTFMVDTRDLDTGKQTTNEYDYCVWAGGVQAAPNYPISIHAMLKNGGYDGEQMHSAEVTELGQGLKGKCLLLVGDSYSAEDLTLQAIKVGAEHVYITSAGK